MALSPFESLPVEVFEAINTLLDLKDLCNIRLTSRTGASKATQDHFGSFLRSRRIELTRPALEVMAEMTGKGRVGSFVEELALVGIVFNTAGLDHQLQKGTKTMVRRGSEGSGVMDKPTEAGTAKDLEHTAAELDQMRRLRDDYSQFHDSGAVASLTGIFENLAANTKRRGLASLSIDVAEYRHDATTPQPASHRYAWRSVWRTAEATFHTFIRSLGVVTSRLPIKQLNFFYNELSGHCSLQCNQLSRCDWHASGLTSTLAGLESLSLSISDRVLDETAHDAVATGDPVERLPDWNAEAYTGKLLDNIDELKSQASADENFHGLVTLLNNCPKLRKLDLRRCFIRRRRSELNNYQRERFLQHLVNAADLPNLQVLSLGNFEAREQDLMRLLQGHPGIRDLTLVDIRLHAPGVWDNIFDYCATNIHSLHLDDLHDQDLHLIHFGEDIENCVVKGLRKSQNIYEHRRQEKDSEKKPIVWQIPRYHRLRPDPAVNAWMERTRDLFGPPKSHHPGVLH